VAGILVAALLADWLSRRTRRLAAGAAALIQGDYSVRIAASGHDELARLTQDFNHLARTLDETRRARQQWIADIAHELRTPLAVLRAEIEALQDGVRPLVRDSMDSLAQEVTQLSRLVEDLRLLSLSDMGALSYHKEPLDLGELIEDAIASQQGALTSAGLHPKLELAPAVRVMADGSRLAQVFANLLQNTLRYTDAPGRLRVRLARSGGRAIVTWEDSSPGVAPVDLPRLTERLFRVDASRSRAGGGSGLGLAIVSAIVEGHGGTMTASQAELGGLRWELSFPLVETSPASFRALPPGPTGERDD
jgi:two-component system sensor histidine kinase BaeS